MQGWGRWARRCTWTLIAVLALTGMTASSALAKFKPTVIAVKESKSGIDPGDVAVVDAQCPEGFAVFGGSYVIDGDSVLAHAAGAAPFFDGRFYRAIIVNPPTSPFVRAQEASVTVVAQCGMEAKPLIVDGPFPSSLKPSNPGYAGTINSRVSSGTVANGDVGKIDSGCGTEESVFGGGYTLSGSIFADAASAAALSKISAFSATVVNPGVNPALGVQESPASVRVAALCTSDGDEVVLNTKSKYHQDARAGRPQPPRNSRATVIIRKATVGGIAAGEIQDAKATCPRGYSVFGGSYLISGNSVLAHASVAAVFSRTNSYGATVVNPPANINTGVPRSTASLTVVANCTKSGRPIVIDGPFGGG